jgi:hypothetical protein
MEQQARSRTEPPQQRGQTTIRGELEFAKSDLLFRRVCAQEQLCRSE